MKLYVVSTLCFVSLVALFSIAYGHGPMNYGYGNYGTTVGVGGGGFKIGRFFGLIIFLAVIIFIFNVLLADNLDVSSDSDSSSSASSDSKSYYYKD